MRRQQVFVTLALLLGAGFGGGAARAADADKAIKEAETTLATFKHTDPGLAAFAAHAAGWAVFPTVGKGAVGIGGAHGSGVLFDHTGKALGTTTLNQVTVGLQLGGQSYSEVIFFETPQAMQNFESGNFALSAQASAVVLKSGSAATAKYQNGVAVFTATKGGLMFEASIGGQKFGFTRFPTQ